MYAFGQLYCMMPSETVEPVDRAKLAHRAVGLARIPLYSAAKAYSVGHKFGKLRNGEFFAGAYVDMGITDIALAVFYDIFKADIQ